MKSLAAALVFFTRLPLWRLYSPPREAFATVVRFWSATGWLTAGVTVGVFWLSVIGLRLNMGIGLLLALTARLLLTGALHEDGLADFFDGFGAGGSRERILAVMKDSHIGTYGVIALVVYFALRIVAVPVPFETACAILAAADPLAKFIASHIVVLPYARTEATSKSGTVYVRYTFGSWLVSAFFGLFPLFYLLDARYWAAAALPLAVFGGLVALMRKKIGGYTGDCCGALFLLCELAFVLGVCILNRWS